MVAIRAGAQSSKYNQDKSRDHQGPLARSVVTGDAKDQHADHLTDEDKGGDIAECRGFFVLRRINTGQHGIDGPNNLRLLVVSPVKL